jgi:hypothetical protein
LSASLQTAIRKHNLRFTPPPSYNNAKPVPGSAFPGDHVLRHTSLPLEVRLQVRELGPNMPVYPALMAVAMGLSATGSAVPQEMSADAARRDFGADAAWMVSIKPRDTVGTTHSNGVLLLIQRGQVAVYVLALFTPGPEELGRAAMPGLTALRFANP